MWYLLYSIESGNVNPLLCNALSSSIHWGRSLPGLSWYKPHKRYLWLTSIIYQQKTISHTSAPPNTTMASSIFNPVAQPSDSDAVMTSSLFGSAATHPPPPSSIPISTPQVSTQPRQLSYVENLPPEIQAIVLNVRGMVNLLINAEIRLLLCWTALAKDTVWPRLKTFEFNVTFSAKRAARFFG